MGVPRWNGSGAPFGGGSLVPPPPRPEPSFYSAKTPTAPSENRALEYRMPTSRAFRGTRTWLAALGVLAGGCLNGCLLLPIPHTRLHAYGVQGRIVSSVNETAVAGASILSEDDSTAHCRSDATGAYRLPPLYGWHGAYFIGPISLSLLPGWDVTSPERTFRISAPGYSDATYTARAREGNEAFFSEKPASRIPADLDGDWLHAGTLKLTPLPGNESAGRE